jgi:hypothetical protein
LTPSPVIATTSPILYNNYTSYRLCLGSVLLNTFPPYFLRISIAFSLF